MTQSKYLITTTDTPNSIVLRNELGDIYTNAIYLTDQLVANGVFAFDQLGAPGLFVDSIAATFDIPIVNIGQDISALSFTTGINGITNAGILRSSYSNLGTISAAVDLPFEQTTVMQFTVGASLTVSNTIIPPAGTQCTLILVTTGTTSRTVTFSSTSFRTTGTLATGILSGRYFVLTFVSDGTKLNEKSRTTASV